jgi:hypothetical protein
VAAAHWRFVEPRMTKQKRMAPERGLLIIQSGNNGDAAGGRQSHAAGARMARMEEASLRCDLSAAFRPIARGESKTRRGVPAGRKSPVSDFSNIPDRFDSSRASEAVALTMQE